MFLIFIVNGCLSVIVQFLCTIFIINDCYYVNADYSWIAYYKSKLQLHDISAFVFSWTESGLRIFVLAGWRLVSNNNSIRSLSWVNCMLKFYQQKHSDVSSVNSQKWASEIQHYKNWCFTQRATTAAFSAASTNILTCLFAYWVHPTPPLKVAYSAI